jgi:tetratricopeptide (TPR) repeat protein
MYVSKVKRKSIPILLIFLLGLPLVFSACRDKGSDMSKKLRLFETQGYRGEDLSKERIEELEKAIKRFEGIVDQKVEASSQLGEYHKMLAIRYMDREMYGKALEHLEEAKEYYPENQVVFYYAGVCSARMAKAAVNDPEEQDRLLTQAENYYERAISLDNNFVDALYGMSVLYIFERDRVPDAEPHIDRILKIEKKNTSAMFLLARVYVYSGRIEEAIELYDRIIQNAQSKAEKKQARDNRQALLEGSFG